MRKSLAIVLPLLVTAALAVPSAASAEPPLHASPPPGQQVTLITGDTVELHGQTPRVIAGEGRSEITFATQVVDGHVTVTPSDALPLLAAGKLDARLFDVTELLRSGYGDAKRDTVGLIVQSARGRSAEIRHAESTKPLPAANATAVRVAKRESRLWESLVDGKARGVKKVWLDGVRKVSLDQSVRQIGAPEAWQRGFDGSGVKVAVLDTGVDETHPDLAGQVVEQRNFSDAATSDDEVGHGTHVAATIASKDAKYRGVAPGARIMDGKVCGSRYCSDSAILAGMQWAADGGAEIVNLSLGSTDTPGVDPLEEAVNRLSAEHGTLFVIAAGNSGSSEFATTIGSPSTADAALSVAAVDSVGRTASFSSRGPRAGDSAVKPEIAAPGVGITAAASTTAMPGRGHVSFSGTSMASPHVAGSAAILAQAHPSWSGERLKAALIGSADATANRPVWEQGAGLANILRAIDQSVTASPATISFGLEKFPHSDDSPKAKEVTYRNSGTSDVTLSLSLTATGPGGAAAPAGMFSVDSDSVVVPAGGTASVIVTSDTRVDGPTGLHSGRLVASGDGVRVTTGFGVNLEAELYDLTLKFTDPTGGAPGPYSAVLVRADGKTIVFHSSDPEHTLRLQAGTWFANVSMRAADSSDRRFYNLYAPNVSLTKDTVLDLDARLAKQASITPPDPAAKTIQAYTSVRFRAPAGWIFSGSITSFDHTWIHTGLIGDPAPAGALNSQVFQTSSAVNGERYGLGYRLPDRVPGGFTKMVGADELSTVRTRIGDSPGAGWRSAFVRLRPSDDAGTVFMPDVRITEPGAVVVDHLTPGDWETWLEHTGPKGRQDIKHPRGNYRVGSVDEKIGIGVFGPSVRELSVLREGNNIRGTVPMFVDHLDGRGYLSPVKAATKLYRDGTVISDAGWPGEIKSVTVPAEEAGYRLTVQLDQQHRTTSTSISADWTFRSAKTDARQPLPLTVVRFEPELAHDLTGPAHQTVFIPVTIAKAPNSPAGAVAEPLIEVSFDDGKTWREAEYNPNKERITLHNPKSGFVSFRASGTDSKGNTFNQTIIRAYQVK